MWRAGTNCIEHVFPTPGWDSSLHPAERRVYVGGGSKARIYHFNFNSQTGDCSAAGEFAAVNDLTHPGHSFIGDVAVSPDGHLLYAADLLENQIAVINLQSGRLIERWKCGRRPTAF